MRALVVVPYLIVQEEMNCSQKSQKLGLININLITHDHVIFQYYPELTKICVFQLLNISLIMSICSNKELFLLINNYLRIKIPHSQYQLQIM